MRTLNIALVGMVVVFAALVLIILCIKIYSGIVTKFSGRKNTNNKSDSEKKEVVETTNVNASSTLSGLSPELVAVITAAITAHMDNSGAGIKVKSIKRIRHTTPIWNVAGRNEYILTRL